VHGNRRARSRPRVGCRRERVPSRTRAFPIPKLACPETLPPCL
jgi:hypothetical protein